MRKLIKQVLRILRLNRFLRKLIMLGFYIFDWVGYSLFYFFPKAKTKQLIKKILIIRIDRVGDLVLSTPAIRAVRLKYPQAQIDVLVQDYTKDVLANNTQLTRVLVYRKDKLACDYDLAFALHPGFKPNFLCYLSGAFIRVGYSGWGGSFFLTQALADDRAKRVRPETDSALEIVKAMHCSAEEKTLELHETDLGRDIASNFLAENNILANDFLVVIHPGARQEYIRWQKEGYAKIILWLEQTLQAKIVLIGTSYEKDLLSQISALAKREVIYALDLRLTGLISLINRANLFVGNSSGPMHLAAALGVNVVALFGAKHPLDSYQMWGPLNKNSIVVSKDTACKYCYPSDCRQFICMEQISAEMVIDAVKRLVKGRL